MDSSEGDILLRASGLGLGYGRQVILRDANFEIHRGEWWFIVGPNGAGKTTLMRGLVGLLPATAGELYRDPEAIRPHRLGFVPQRCDLNPSLPTTIREFVLLGLVGQRIGRPERAERLREALSHVGLGSLVDADYWSLSGGQRQRALLARALVRRPHVLLLDEPTAGLDLSAADGLMRVLLGLNRSLAVTMLFITHDVELAARYATHAAVVHGGIVTAGPAGEVLNADLLQRVYGMRIDVREGGAGAATMAVGERTGAGA